MARHACGLRSRSDKHTWKRGKNIGFKILKIILFASSPPSSSRVWHLISPPRRPRRKDPKMTDSPTPLLSRHINATQKIFSPSLLPHQFSKTTLLTPAGGAEREKKRKIPGNCVACAFFLKAILTGKRNTPFPSANHSRGEGGG